MSIEVLDKDFQTLYMLDDFSSIIWTARFVECGDFELCVSASEDILQRMSTGYYIMNDEFYDKETNRAPLMIVESINITRDTDKVEVRFTGRDLKSILDRRIIWSIKTFPSDTHIETVIRTLLYENVITPSDWYREYQNGDLPTPITISVPAALRAIPDFIYENRSSENPPIIDSDTQFGNESLYDTINNLCASYELGWDIVYDFGLEVMVFILKSRVDRTYSQTNNTPIIFSTKLENLLNSEYIESSSTEKNAALILGEGDEYNVMYNVYPETPTLSGLNRKEIVINSGLSRKDDVTGDEYGNETYLKMLYNKGVEEIGNNKYVRMFNGTAKNVQYIYGVDYNVGDICELVNEYNIQSNVLISEVVLSMDKNNKTILPTFETIERS